MKTLDAGEISATRWIIYELFGSVCRATRPTLARVSPSALLFDERQIRG